MKMMFGWASAAVAWLIGKSIAPSATKATSMMLIACFIRLVPPLLVVVFSRRTSCFATGFTGLLQVLSQTLDENEQNYHLLLSTQPGHRTALREFETQ